MTKPIMLITYNSLKREDWDLIAMYIASWYKHTLVIYPVIEWQLHKESTAYIVDNAILNAQRYARVSV